MKTPEEFKREEEAIEKERLQNLRAKVERFVSTRVRDSSGGEGEWSSGRTIDPKEESFVQGVLAEAGWKGHFWINSEESWSMTAKSYHTSYSIMLKITPLKETVCQSQ